MESASATRDGDRVIIRFKANAFLHQQVRRMTGALVEAGKPSAGPKSIPESFENIRNLLDRPERGAATRLMAPQGLCLTRIDYPGNGIRSAARVAAAKTPDTQTLRHQH